MASRDNGLPVALQAPVVVPFERFGFVAQHFHLDPDAELHSLAVRVFGQFGGAVGKGLKVRMPVTGFAEPVGLVVPTGIEHENFRANVRGDIHAPFHVGEVHFAGERIPGVELDQGRFVGRVARHDELPLIAVQRVGRVVEVASSAR